MFRLVLPIKTLSRRETKAVAWLEASSPRIQAHSQPPNIPAQEETRASALRYSVINMCNLVNVLAFSCGCSYSPLPRRRLVRACKKAKEKNRECARLQHVMERKPHLKCGRCLRAKGEGPEDGTDGGARSQHENP